MLVTGGRRRTARWLQESAWARGVYDVVAAVVAGSVPAAPRVAVAAQAPLETWQRVLALESCGAWLDGARRQSPATAALLAPAEPLLRATSAQALRTAITAMQQLAEIAGVAAASNVRVLALKGAARLLAGEPPGSRSMSDIDVLVSGDGASAIFETLQSAHGYMPDTPGTPTRHLPSLGRPSSLPVEIHRRLNDEGSSAIEERVWVGTRPVSVGRGSIEIPDATALLVHALEHAVVVHRAARFRLRDVLDVSALATRAVDWMEVERYVAGHADRGALRTLLAAAQSVPDAGREGVRRPDRRIDARERQRAWRRIRRVGRTRLLAPARTDIAPASDPRVVLLSQLAQGSPRSILRLAARAIAMPIRALRLVSGAWLPAEAERGRDDEEAVAPPVR
jgi:hypothetical protein